MEILSRDLASWMPSGKPDPTGSSFEVVHTPKRRLSPCPLLACPLCLSHKKQLPIYNHSWSFPSIWPWIEYSKPWYVLWIFFFFFAEWLNECESESHSVASDSLRPHGLYNPWNSPGQNTGVGSLSLLQGIFPTQGLNPGLLHCRRILYQLSHKGSPEWMCTEAIVYLCIQSRFILPSELCFFSSHR